MRELRKLTNMHYLYLGKLNRVFYLSVINQKCFKTVLKALFLYEKAYRFSFVSVCAPFQVRLEISPRRTLNPYLFVRIV